MAAKTQTAPEVPTERPRTASSLSSGSRLESLSGTEGRSSLTPTKSHRKNSGSGSGSASGSGAPGHNEIQQEFQRFFCCFFWRSTKGWFEPALRLLGEDSGGIWSSLESLVLLWLSQVRSMVVQDCGQEFAPCGREDACSFQKGVVEEKRIHKLASLKQDKGFWPDRCLQGSLRTMSTFEQI